jgi:hypothetical protein
MKPKRLLPLFLFAGVLTGVYTFDLRKAWADEPVAPTAVEATEIPVSLR